MSYLKLFLKTLTITVFALTLSMGFSSCSDDDDEELVYNEPGEIPGLGTTPGELTGTPFSLPNGLKLAGEIEGLNVSYYGRSLQSKTELPEISTDFVALFKLARASSDTIMGSGVWVNVSIPVENTTNRNIDAKFPAGLILEANTTGYQYGLLLKKVDVSVPANSVYKINLNMYCANKTLSASSTYARYRWGVVSNSSLIRDLCNRLKNKQINIEEFDRNNSTEISVYRNQVNKIQQILWNLTDLGYPLSDDDKEYLAELPNS